MTFEVDHSIPEDIISEIKNVDGINRVIVINQLGGVS